MSDFQFYRKNAIQPMRPYVPGEDLYGISVSAEDTPEMGGMIAVDPNNPADKWYVAKTFFEANYEPATLGDFGRALALLKAGKRVARSGWNGKGMFVFLVPGSTFQVSRAPLLGIYPEGTTIDYGPHIDMKTADGKIVPWLASQTDVLATDWAEVPA